MKSEKGLCLLQAMAHKSDGAGSQGESNVRECLCVDEQKSKRRGGTEDNEMKREVLRQTRRR